MRDFILENVAPVREDEIELRAWLERCKEIFKDRNALEIGNLAVWVGFDRAIVYRVMSEFPYCLVGSSLDNVAALSMWAFENTVERINKIRDELKKVPELDLSEKWQRLVDYSVTGEI